MIIDFASLPSVKRGRRGVVVFVDDDALGVAKQLEEMQFPEGYGKVRLAWDEFKQVFVVIQVKDDGTEHLVTFAEQADGRLVDRVRRITHPSYDFGKELEAIDAAADKERDREFSEAVGERAERLAHAIRKDTQAQNRIFIRNGLPPAA